MAASRSLLFVPLAFIGLPSGFSQSAPVVQATPFLVSDPRLRFAPEHDQQGTQRLAPAGDAWDKLSGEFSSLLFAPSGANGFGAVTSFRGLSNTPFFGSSALTVYLDDLPLPSSFATPALLPGYRSLELWRGPQSGFLVGRASSAGTLVFSSPAWLRGSTSELRTSLGDQGELQASATSGFSAEGWSAQATLAVEEREGYLTNQSLGQETDSASRQALRSRLDFQPNEVWDFSLQLLATRARDGEQALAPLGSYSPVTRDNAGNVDADFLGGAFRATANGTLGSLSSVTSWVRQEVSPFYSWIELPPAFASTVEQSQSAWQQEIRFSSLPQAEYPWVLGVWGSSSRTTGNVDRRLFGTIPYEASHYKLLQDTFAAYGQTVLLSDEAWTLEAGLRAERVLHKFTRASTVPSPASFKASQNHDELSPKLTARWTPSRHQILNVSWSHGVKAGGYSAYTGNTALAAFAPEKNHALEGSWRLRWPGRGGLTVRGYQYSLSNYQIERSFTEADYLVVNAPRARARGVEVELNWPLATNLMVDASLGWNDTVLRQFTDPFTNTVLDGNRAPYAPAFTQRVDLTYRLGRWTASVGATRLGSTYFDESETALYRQKDYILARSRVDYAWGRWTFSLVGENLTDEDYYTQIITGVAHGVVGLPRRLRAEVAYRW